MADGAPKSIFPSTSSDASRELVLILDAIEQLIAAAHLHYRRIQSAALHFGGFSEQPDSEEARAAKTLTEVAVVADVGALIGTIHRLRLLVNRLPGDETIRIAKQAFQAGVRQLEQARHHLEHLDTAVAEIAQTSEGAFGAVSWWEDLGDGKMRWVAIFPGTLAEGAEAVTRNPKRLTERIDHTWAAIAGRYLDVTAAHRSVPRLEERLREWGASQAGAGWPALERNRED